MLCLYSMVVDHRCYYLRRIITYVIIYSNDPRAAEKGKRNNYVVVVNETLL